MAALIDIDDKFAQKVREGQPYALRHGDNRIKAATIVDTMLRNCSADGLQRPVVLRASPSCRLTITGSIALKDAVGPDGGALPPLILTNCTFETDTGQPEVDVSRAHLSRLSLRGTPLRWLIGSGCQIDGDCDLSGWEPIESEPRCHLRMDGARIDGSLKLSGRAFGTVSDEQRSWYLALSIPRTYRDAAIDLSFAEIAGELEMIGVDASGLVNLRDSVIRQNARIMDCTMVDLSRSTAIDARSIRINGSLLVRHDARNERHDGYHIEGNNIDGKIMLEDARIEGDVIIKDGYFGRLGNAATDAISLANARIGGDLHLGENQQRLYPTGIDGRINLRASRIGGSVTIRGINARPQYTGLAADIAAGGIGIGKHMYLEGSRLKARRTDGTSREPVALDLERSEIGFGLKLDKTTVLTGALVLSMAAVTRGVTIRCSVHGIDESDPAAATTMPRLIDLKGARIEGSVEIGRSDHEPSPKMRVNGAILLNRAVVTERIRLQNIQIGYQRRPEPLSADLIEAEQTLLKSTQDVVLGLNLVETGGLTTRGLEIFPLQRGPATRPEETLPRRGPRSWLRLWGDDKVRDLSGRDSVGIVDLDGLKTGSLEDDDGNGWGLDPRVWLRLGQIEIGRIDERRSSNAGAPPVERKTDRLLFLAAESLRRTENKIPIHLPWGKRDMYLIEWHSKIFSPQAYNALARAYIQGGHVKVGRAILTRRISIETYRNAANVASRYRTRPQQEQNPVWRTVWSTLAGAYLAIMTLYRWTFLYGLSTKRALFTFTLFMMGGIMMIFYMQHPLANPLTYLHDGVPERRALPILVKDEPDWPATRIGGTPVTFDPAEPGCDHDTITLAADLFIPLLDTGLAGDCKVRTDDQQGAGDHYYFWRLWLLFYQVLGWIITSLTVLTVSGIIRRDVDR